MASVIASTVGGLRTVALLLAPASQAGSATPSRRSALCAFRSSSTTTSSSATSARSGIGLTRFRGRRRRSPAASPLATRQSSRGRVVRMRARTQPLWRTGKRLGLDSSSPEAAWQPVGGRRGRDGSAVDPLSFTRECTRGVPAACGADQRLSGLGWAVLSHAYELGVATWVSSPQAVRSSGRTRAARTPCLRCE